jgi:dihydroneopterin aldolase
MSQIAIEGMEFFAYHGCFPEEQIIGNKFIVDVWMEVDTREAADSDNLSQTVNYQHVYEVIKKEMEVTSKLLEHLGQRIINAVCAGFPSVEKISVKVSKLNPPIGGKVDRVSVLMNQNCK